MATIAKSYYITHINKLAIHASSWRRPFDDLYDTINSRLDSSNMSSSFGIQASQVNYSDSTGFFSSTNLQNSLYELLPEGFHDIHFQCYGQRLSIFPGRAEVNGALARVRTKINISISNLVHTTGSLILGNTYGVLFNPEANITQSDIFLHPVTATALVGNYQTGLYVTSATTSRRGLFTFIWDEACNATAWEFLTPPVSPFSYLWADSEALAHPLFAQSYNATAGRVSAVIQMYNNSHFRYDYHIAGILASTTALVTILSNLSSCMEDLFIIERMTVAAATTVWSFNGHELKTSGGAPTILMGLMFTQSFAIFNQVPATLGTATYDMILTTRLNEKRLT